MNTFNPRMKLMLCLLMSLFTVGCTEAQERSAADGSYNSENPSGQPKREFRGAWIQAVNGQWQGVGRDDGQRAVARVCRRWPAVCGHWLLRVPQTPVPPLI